MRKLLNKKFTILIVLFFIMIILFIFSLFVGSSKISFSESLNALFGNGQKNHIIIMQNIRLPRAIAALVVGCGLAVAGLIMQTTLSNEMASPSTLGVSNAATLGANISIIVLAGGFLNTGNNVQNFFNGNNVFSTSLIAFVFSFISVLITLGLCKIKSFSKETVILCGVAMAAIWTALTSLIQFYATDVSLSAAIVWSFGDLARATYQIDLIILIVLLISITFFFILSNRYNAMLAGDDIAKSVGVNVGRFRFISLLIASLLTAVCIANIGIIGFVGIICPHIAKKIFGYNHKYTIWGSVLLGAILLLVSDTLARTVGNGSAIPVGIITSLVGAPFFLYIIFRRKRGDKNA
ncbi:MAG: iron ABC transporter permease [Acholeplasmatales bacterium]|nr:iron ABC transporter permease [Acholeplasmatales bacterium]